MSYNVIYDGGTLQKLPVKRKLNKKWIKAILIVGCILLFAVLLNITSIRRLVLPGDPVVTERAIGKMVDELKDGESVYEAISTFCHEVIEGGLQR